MKNIKDSRVANLNRALRQTKFWWLEGDAVCLGTKKAGALHRFLLSDFSALHPDLPEKLHLVYHMHQETTNDEAWVPNDYLSLQRDICIAPRDGYRLRLTSSGAVNALLGDPEVVVGDSYVRVYGEALLSDAVPAALVEHYLNRPVPHYLLSKGVVCIDTDAEWMDREYPGWNDRYTLAQTLSLGPAAGTFIFGRTAASEALDLPGTLMEPTL